MMLMLKVLQAEQVLIQCGVARSKSGKYRNWIQNKAIERDSLDLYVFTVWKLSNAILIYA